MQLALFSGVRSPGYSFGIHLKEKEKRIGHINLRVGNTEHVTGFVGHIGFGIDEEYRGNSYAAKACIILKPFASGFSDSVILTCNPDNSPSIRTLEKIGARFLEEIEVPQGNPVRERLGEEFKRRYEWKFI